MTSLARRRFDTQAELKRILDACAYLLKHTEEARAAREYLDSRLDKPTQRELEFGYFPSNDKFSLLTELIDKDVLKRHKLYYPKYLSGGLAPNGHFSENNLIMPFRDVHNNIVAFIGRSLLSSEELKEQKVQKYKYSLDFKKDMYVYGLHHSKSSIIEKNYAIGVEGQFDYAALRQAGVNNVIAFGCADVSKFQMFQVHRYTNNLVLMFDTDEAGKKGKTRVVRKYSDYANIKTFGLPSEHKDIDELLRHGSDTKQKEGVIELLRNLPYGE